ncbi:MAG: rhodanese-like domain-containing [Planctomycetota bacterium]|nr:MAG: rhodanese-like domain-containing [Planctomycetota bacterium]
MVALGCGNGVPPDLSKTGQEIREKFPGVKQLATGDLAAWLADGKRPKPVLLDVRSEEEWKVSRLPGAKHTPPGTKPDDALAGVAKDAPVVVYCSVGYRSSAYAEKLQKEGWTNVVNLEGSIFAWANEGRPVVDEKGPASKVHPYDAKWGELLKQELRAPLK